MLVMMRQKIARDPHLAVGEGSGLIGLLAHTHDRDQGIPVLEILDLVLVALHRILDVTVELQSIQGELVVQPR